MSTSLVAALFSSVLISLLALPAVAAQQGCNDELIMKARGGWKKGADGNMRPGPEAAQAIIRIDRFSQLLQAAYPEPKGIQARWYRELSDKPSGAGDPMPYQLIAMFLTYDCNPASPTLLSLAGETAAWFYVFANHLNWFAEEKTFFTIAKNPAYMLTRKVGEFKGYPLYEGIHNATRNTGTTYSRAIIITRPGQSPYVPVTKQQFLRVSLTHYEKEKVRSLAAFEGPYPGSNAMKEQWMQRTSKSFDDRMKPAQELLGKLSEEEARQPAIVDYKNYLEFTSFTTEEKGGQMLVRRNPDYFDAKLPGYVPQFFVVYWRWYKGKPEENFKNELEAKLDFTALQQMIDQ